MLQSYPAPGRMTLHCKLVISCFFSKHFGASVESRGFDPRDPSSASYLSTFSPGRRLVIKPPSPRGEGGGHAPPGEGSLRQPITT